MDKLQSYQVYNYSCIVVLIDYTITTQLTLQTRSILFAGDKMVRNITTKFTEKDYHIFSRIANDYGLSVEEKLQEIVDIYLIVEKTSSSKLE